MRKFLVTTSLFLMATTAIAQQSTTEATGVNSALGVAPTTEDFVAQASMSDMFEIESSKLAVERSDVATKTFAEQMIQGHQKTTAELKALVDGGKVKIAPATAMSGDQKDSIEAMKKLQGADFIAQYHDDQVEAHEDAVDLFKRYADGGENADLKAWAAKTVPDLEHHLKMAEDLDKE
jgi:putative membrane protein